MPLTAPETEESKRRLATDLASNAVPTSSIGSRRNPGNLILCCSIATEHHVASTRLSAAAFGRRFQTKGRMSPLQDFRRADSIVMPIRRGLGRSGREKKRRARIGAR